MTLLAPTPPATSAEVRAHLLRALEADLPDDGLFDDGLEQVRLRVKAGVDFDTAIDDALAKAYEEKSALGRQITADADEQSEAHKKVAG